MATPPRHSTAPLYSDSLFAMPVFALLYKATDDRKHLDTLDHFARTVTAELFDKDEGLFYRDGTFIGKKTPAGKKILWSRGNGWVFSGLPRTSECLPPDDPRREFFITQMRTMAAALAKCQGEDGFWHPNLADLEHVPVPESSGTAFFCHGMAWGIRNGVLDKETYLPVVKKAWTALAGAVSTTGMVQWGQQVGDRPSKTQQAESHEYVTGLYRVHPGSGNNWGVVNLAGEFLRHRQGFTSLDYVEASLAGQMKNFTELGMYDENGNPFPYDHFSRYYLAGMLDRGYVGPHQPDLRELLWRAAWVSLFMQSPNGEMPTGFRSSHHIWNEAEQCVTFELYATAYGKAGRLAEAGAFKRAARLSLQSVKEWIRPDGSGFIVKNRHPIEAKHGYEGYSAHSCYNILY